MSFQGLTADGWKIVLENAKGPVATTNVGTGLSADIDLPIIAGPVIDREILGLKSIDGLPDGIVLQNITYPDLKTVRLRVRNHTGAVITINANAVTAVVLAKAV